MTKEIGGTHKYVEINYSEVARVGQWRNHKGNWKTLWDEWKWRHNKPKFMGCSA